MSDSGLEQFILDHLTKLGDKLDQVRDESTKLNIALKSQADLLEQYNKHLQDHMKRSDELEKSHRKMWERVEPVVVAHENEGIVRKWMAKSIKSKLTWITAIGTVASTVAVILKLYGIL